MLHGGIAQGGDQQIERRRRLAGLHAHHQAVFADGESDARRVNLRTQRFGEPVVAAAAQDGVLRAQRAVHHFERSAHVIVQTAYHARPDLGFDAAALQEPAHRREVVAAWLTQMVQNAGKPVDDGLVGLHLAIQHAQGVGFGAALAIAAHSRSHGFQLLAQALDELRAAIVVAHGIEEKPEIRQAGAAEQFHHHLDDFGVHQRRFRPDGLRADLEELAVAALLRPLAAEHGPHVEQLLHAGALVEAVLDVGADHRGGVLGAQGERRAVTIVEGVHLLGDDVGFGAHAAGEELGFLQDGGADLVVVVAAKHRARNGFHAIPHRGGWGQ